MCEKNVETDGEAKQPPIEVAKIQTSQATTVDNHNTSWGTPCAPIDNAIKVTDKDMLTSSHSSGSKTKPIQFLTMKDIESQQQMEENREGKIKSLCAPSVLLKSTESEPLGSWEHLGIHLNGGNPKMWREKMMIVPDKLSFHDPNQKQ